MRRFATSVLLLASTAHADRPPSPEAKVYLDHGLDKFDAKDYSGAIAEFDAGYAIDPSPAFLYNKAQAQRLGGDCRSAIVTYEAYLSSDDAPAQGDNARTNITRCEQQLAAAKPPPEPPHAGSGSAVEPAKPPPSDPVQIVKHDEGAVWYHDPLGLALVGGGAIAFGIAIYAANTASTAAADATNAANLDDWIANHNAWNQDREVAGIAAGIGGALALGAILRFASVSRSDTVTTAVPARGGGMVVVGGAW